MVQEEQSHRPVMQVVQYLLTEDMPITSELASRLLVEDNNNRTDQERHPLPGAQVQLILHRDRAQLQLGVLALLMVERLSSNSSNNQMRGRQVRCISRSHRSRIIGSIKKQAFRSRINARIVSIPE